jgi:outer membrane protein insertion porin family/translocation and assembly module TamA
MTVVKNRARGVFLNWLVCAFVSLLLGSYLFAAEGDRSELPPDTAKPPSQVRFITFEGNKTFSSGELKKILNTKEKRFRWFFKAPLDEKAFQDDLDKIQKFYASQGFYHMQLLSGDIVPLTGKDVRVAIRLDEGPPMIVSELNLTVDCSSEKTRREILKVLPLKPGSRFTTPDYRDIEKAAVRYLSDLGHPKAKVDMRARLDKRSDRASITASVQIGPVCSFGAVRVEGNESVAADVILREVRFHKGDRFNGSKIDETQRRLFALDLFQFIDISVENVESEDTVLPIRILVKESKKQTIRLGAGYGTEDQVRGQAQYEIRDFFGDGRHLQINLKASSIVQLLEGRFTQPYFLQSPGSLIVDAGILHESQESYENEKVYMRPFYEYKWSDNLLSFFGYNLEFNRLLSVDLSPAEKLATDQDREQYYVSSLIGGTTWEKVDSQLDPHKGWRLLENMEWATSVLGSQVDYFKVTVDGRVYLPTFDYGVLAAKLKWGGIEPLESTTEVPIFKRFFSGGTDSVRGYPYQRLGPLDSTGNAIGGMELLEGSVEWRFPIRKPFEGVIFSDFGNVAPDIERFSWSDTRYTAGVGFRYLTPIGPLRFDVGYELNPPEQKFFTPYQFHFSIGQAF